MSFVPIKNKYCETPEYSSRYTHSPLSGVVL